MRMNTPEFDVESVGQKTTRITTLPSFRLVYHKSPIPPCVIRRPVSAVKEPGPTWSQPERLPSYREVHFSGACAATVEAAVASARAMMQDVTGLIVHNIRM